MGTRLDSLTRGSYADLLIVAIFWSNVFHNHDALYPRTFSSVIFIYMYDFCNLFTKHGKLFSKKLYIMHWLPLYLSGTLLDSQINIFGGNLRRVEIRLIPDMI